MNVPSETSPIRLPSRQQLPDQLRGIALLGIVLVNIPFLAVTNEGLLAGENGSVADDIVSFLIVALAQGKFYLLFSFLFGYSLTLTLRTPSADGLRRYRRRLLGLAVLGILHATLFFIGDILLSYALLGVALLWFATRSTRVALIGSVIAYVVGLGILTTVVVASIGVNAQGSGIVFDAGSLDAAIAGSFTDAAAGRLAALPGALVTQSVLNWAPALAMFLLGLAAGRAGVLAEPLRYRTLWRWLLAGAALLGLPAGIASAWLSLVVNDPTGFTQVLGTALGFASAPLLTGGYVALAAIFTDSRLMRLAAPAGRMSLTGYLGESILLAAIFCGWGIGLFGRLPIAVAALVAIGVWFALDFFAHLWLRRFAYGPFEWLLRSWTMARWVPLRRVAVAPAP